LAIASVAYGALLGVFLLGVLTRRANQYGTTIGMACGLAAEIYVWSATRVPWTWYVVIGSAVTFLVGYAASALLGEAPESEHAREKHVADLRG
jgi:Na+/proline symporter